MPKVTETLEKLQMSARIVSDARPVATTRMRFWAFLSFAENLHYSVTSRSQPTYFILEEFPATSYYYFAIVIIKRRLNYREALWNKQQQCVCECRSEDGGGVHV